MATPDLPSILDEMNSLIQRDIAAGFLEPESIIVDAVQYFGDVVDPELLEVAARRMADEALREHLLEQLAWPEVTDCDRLDEAFASLEREGILCRHNYTCCGTCGVAEIMSEIAARRAAGDEIQGYVFYHQQDTESAVDGDGLRLNYGAVVDGEAAALVVAREVLGALAEHGLRTEWNGRWSQRIGVEIDWKRRRAG